MPTSEIWAVDARTMDALDAGQVEKVTPGEMSERLGIAVVPLRGVLTQGGLFGGAYDFLRMVAEAVIADGGVEAVVLDIDSPGGSVAGLDDAAAAVAMIRERMPVLAYTGGSMGSAAYRIGIEADEIMCGPNALVGSVGCRATVVAPESGRSRTFVSKISPNKARDIDDEGFVERMEGFVDAMGQRFAEAVAERRGVSLEFVRDNFGGGDMMGADEAAAVGAVDRVGLLGDAVRRAADLIDSRSSTAAPVIGGQIVAQTKEGAMPIRYEQTADLGEGKVIVALADLEAVENTHKALAAERDLHKSAAESATAKADEFKARLDALEAQVAEDKAAAEEAERLEARDLLVADAIKTGRLGPQDTDLRAKLVAYGDALGNTELAAFINAMPQRHTPGDAPQGRSGDAEPATAALDTRDAVVAHVRKLTADSFGGDFNAAWRSFASDPKNAEAVRLWTEE